MEENNKILDRHVGHKIRERRKLLGLTQAELANILCVSHQQIQRYESGENTVTMARLLEIADSLNVKLNYFYENAPLLRSSSIQKHANGIITQNLDRPLRLLLIEDSSSDELLFRKAVEHSQIPVDMHLIQNSQMVMDFLLHCDTKYGALRPDIVLLDINMPHIDGLSLLRKIKTDQKLKALPVIMLTNSVRTKDMQESYINHANGFIQKKSDLNEFYTDIKLLLEYWTRTMILPEVLSA